jgi:hypothetical protein
MQWLLWVFAHPQAAWLGHQSIYLCTCIVHLGMCTHFVHRVCYACTLMCNVECTIVSALFWTSATAHPAPWPRGLPYSPPPHFEILRGGGGGCHFDFSSDNGWLCCAFLSFLCWCPLLDLTRFHIQTHTVCHRRSCLVPLSQGCLD